MKIFLISRFNTNNIGDVVISHTLKETFEKYADVKCISLFGSATKLTNINKIIDYKEPHRYSKVAIILKKIYLAVYLFICLNKNSLVVLGGGNAMCDLTEKTKSALRYDLFMKTAKIKKSKIVAVDIGIGPFATENQKNNAVRFLERLDYVTFRDASSLELYRTCTKCDNAALSVDPALFYELKETKTAGEKRKIAINVLNAKLIGFESTEEICKKYYHLGEELVEKLDAEVTFFITDSADTPCFDTISTINNNPKINFARVSGINDLFELYDAVDILIGTRMHSLILGNSRRLPIIGLDWQSKVRDLFERLNISDRLFPYETISGDNDNFITDICHEVERIYSNYDSEISKIIANQNKLNNLRSDAYVVLSERVGLYSK